MRVAADPVDARGRLQAVIDQVAETDTNVVRFALRNLRPTNLDCDSSAWQLQTRVRILGGPAHRDGLEPLGVQLSGSTQSRRLAELSSNWPESP